MPLDLVAWIVGIIIFCAVGVHYDWKWRGRKQPPMADFFDMAACLGIMTVLTAWLGVFDSGPREYSGTLAVGEGMKRLFLGFLKVIFLVIVPACLLMNGMRRTGGPGRRAAIYCGFAALALAVWLIAR